MPLLDLDWGGSYPRDLGSFLTQWSSTIADGIHKQLPAVERRFLAELTIRSRLKQAERVTSFNYGAPPVYTPDGHETGERYPSFDAPQPMFTAPARLCDHVGVEVIDRLEGRDGGAAVLFVTLDHTADSDGALVFALRAANLMSTGVGVVIVDITAGPRHWATHLHSLTGVFPTARRPRGAARPVLVVHPRVSGDAARYDVWHHAVEPGSALPTVPLPIRGAMMLRLDLEATYTEACERSRVP
ncbi:MAG: hypothetical protein K2P78_07160 [Gemmataceae bacterium]|nr:hypothetical protein [Gemmataceae bacterium]